MAQRGAEETGKRSGIPKAALGKVREAVVTEHQGGEEGSVVS